MTRALGLLSIVLLPLLTTSCFLAPDPPSLPRPLPGPISETPPQAPTNESGIEIGVGTRRIVTEPGFQGRLCPSIKAWPMPPRVKKTDFGITLGVETPEQKFDPWSTAGAWGNTQTTYEVPVEPVVPPQPAENDALIRDDD